MLRLLLNVCHNLTKYYVEHFLTKWIYRYSVYFIGYILKALFLQKVLHIICKMANENGRSRPKQTILRSEGRRIYFKKKWRTHEDFVRNQNGALVKIFDVQIIHHDIITINLLNKDLELSHSEN